MSDKTTAPTAAQKIVPAWEAESLEERLHRCRRMLYLHNCLTEAEEKRVGRRIPKIAIRANSTGRMMENASR